MSGFVEATIAALKGIPAFGERAWTDDASDFSAAERPGGVTFPFASVLPDLSAAPALTGDGRALVWRRVGQIDIWQAIEDEDPALVRATVAALESMVVEARIHVVVESVTRVADPNPGIVHHSLTVATRSPSPA